MKKHLVRVFKLLSDIYKVFQSLGVSIINFFYCDISILNNFSGNGNAAARSLSLSMPVIRSLSNNRV